MNNLTKSEKDHITNLFLKYKHIIENEKTDASTRNKKHKQWEIIKNEYNAKVKHQLRTVSQVKKAWNNVKTKRKRELAEVKEKVARGIPSPSSSPIVYQLDELYPSTVMEVCDVQDSDIRYLRPQVSPSDDNSPTRCDFQMPVGETLYTTITSEKESPLIMLVESSELDPLTIDTQPPSSTQPSEKPSSLHLSNETSCLQIADESMTSSIDSVTEATTLPILLTALSASVSPPPIATSQSHPVFSTVYTSSPKNLPKITLEPRRQNLRGQSVGITRNEAIEMVANIRVERVRQLIKMDKEFHEARLKMLFETQKQTLQNLKNQDMREAETHQKEISKGAL